MSVGKGVKLGFGIGIGIALFLLVIVLAASLLDRQMPRIRERAMIDRERSSANFQLWTLLTSCGTQANEDGQWPSDIAGCWADLSDVSAPPTAADVILCPNITDYDHFRKIAAYERPDKRADGLHVGFVNGKVEWVSHEEFRKLMQEDRNSHLPCDE